MIRNTPKRRAAIQCLSRLTGKHVSPGAINTNERLYGALEQYGYHWHAKERQWTQEPLATSVFADPYGNPTAQFGLRIMAHPDTAIAVQDLLVAFLAGYGADLTRISHPDPNRNGPGARIYIEGTLPTKRRKA